MIFNHRLHYLVTKTLQFSVSSLLKPCFKIAERKIVKKKQKKNPQKNKEEKKQKDRKIIIMANFKITNKRR